MIVSKGLVCSLIQSYVMTLQTNKTTAGLILCVGTQPTDAEADAITTSSTIVTNNQTCSFNMTGFNNALFSQTEFPPRYVCTSYPTTNAVAATKAGTISWGLLVNGAWGIAVVDVTGPNGGGMVEVNTTNVIVGTSVYITNWSFKLNR